MVLRYVLERGLGRFDEAGRSHRISLAEAVHDRVHVIVRRRRDPTNSNLHSVSVHDQPLSRISVSTSARRRSASQSCSVMGLGAPLPNPAKGAPRREDARPCADGIRDHPGHRFAVHDPKRCPCKTELLIVTPLAIRPPPPT